MDCGEFQRFVHAYIDGEFEPEDAEPLEEHASTCDTCRQLAEREASFRHHIKQTYTSEPAPEELRRRLAAVLEARDAMALAAAAPPALVVSRAAPRWRRLEWVIGPALALAAALVLVVLARGAFEAPAAPQATPDAAASSAPIIAEAVTWHRRNLPIEVTGPSTVRVRHWFDGKVDFPVRLPEFDRQETGAVNLLGARLGHVKERQAAYVVYEVQGNKMSVIAFDGRDLVATQRPDRGQPIVFENAGGYNVALVEDNGITYSITSELPRADMEKLVQAAFQPASTPAPAP